MKKSVYEIIGTVSIVIAAILAAIALTLVIKQNELIKQKNSAWCYFEIDKCKNYCAEKKFPVYEFQFYQDGPRCNCMQLTKQTINL